MKAALPVDGEKVEVLLQWRDGSCSRMTGVYGQLPNHFVYPKPEEPLFKGWLLPPPRTYKTFLPRLAEPGYVVYLEEAP